MESNTQRVSHNDNNVRVTAMQSSYDHCNGSGTIMNSSAVEFVIWFLLVLIIFYAVNEYGGLKRFASVLVAFLISSIVIFFAYQGDLLSEIFITATFLILALFGLSAALRSRRSDFERDITKK
jgi:glycerol uptake facilitator-like aquaporin